MSSPPSTPVSRHPRRRSRRTTRAAANPGRLVAAVAASVVLVVGIAGAAPAQEPPDPATPVDSAARPAAPNPLFPSPPPEIAPELADIPLHSNGYDAAKQARDDARATLDRTVKAKDDAATAILDLSTRRQVAAGEIMKQSLSVQVLTAELTQLRTQIRSLALGSYVAGQGMGDANQTALDLDVSSANDEGKAQTTMRATRVRMLARERQTSALLGRTEAAVRNDSTELHDIDGDLAGAVARHDKAVADETGQAIDLLARTRDLEGTRGLSEVVGLDFPLVALDAYWKAAKSQQACGIQWWALAGIGRTESDHGTEGGAKVSANGDTSKPIVGIALDGSAGTASISDTDHGLFDGDPFHDRAVGPMQFIPSTWLSWARDGNADAKADPNNFYDATMGAAAYLCASGPMRTDADLIRGFLSYNNDPYYAALVLQRAKTYGLALPQLGTPPSSPPAATLPPAPASGQVTKGVAGAPPTAPPTTAPPGAPTTAPTAPTTSPSPGSTSPTPPTTAPPPVTTAPTPSTEPASTTHSTTTAPPTTGSTPPG